MIATFIWRFKKQDDSESSKDKVAGSIVGSVSGDKDCPKLRMGHRSPAFVVAI